MRYLNLATLATAIWWSTVLFEWAKITDPHSAEVSFGLSGSELSQTLTLLPAIVILIALIARYQKVPNQIMFLASAVALWASYSAFTLNAASTPAAVEGLENLTGIAGVVGSQSLTFGPLTYSLLAIVIAGLSFMAGLAGKQVKNPLVDRGAEPDDPRSLWDSQS